MDADDNRGLQFATIVRWVPIAAILTMITVYVISGATDAVAFWPLSTVSRFGAAFPAVYLWRVVTIGGGVLMLQAAHLTWPRSHALSCFLGLGGIGAAGLGTFSVVEASTTHNVFTLVFVVALVGAQVVLFVSARVELTQEVCCSGSCCCGRTLPLPGHGLFKPDRPSRRTYRCLVYSCCATCLVVVAGVIGGAMFMIGVGNINGYELWSILEVVFLFVEMIFLSCVADSLFVRVRARRPPSGGASAAPHLLAPHAVPVAAAAPGAGREDLPMTREEIDV
jgi:hypothetical protein